MLWRMTAPVPPPQGQPATQQPKKAWYTRWWVWLIAAFVLIGVIGALTQGADDTDAAAPTETETTQPEPVTDNDTTEEEAEEPTEEPSEPAEPEEPEVPAEYKSALTQAGNYANTLHMSKAGIFDQLTSEYGGQFTEEAAQYAIDNVEADWNANALAKAKDYQELMSMSPAAIRDQLVSEYGEKFTEAEADYAIQHLND